MTSVSCGKGNATVRLTSGETDMKLTGLPCNVDLKKTDDIINACAPPKLKYILCPNNITPTIPLVKGPLDSIIDTCITRDQDLNIGKTFYGWKQVVFNVEDLDLSACTSK